MFVNFRIFDDAKIVVSGVSTNSGVYLQVFGLFNVLILLNSSISPCFETTIGMTLSTHRMMRCTTEINKTRDM